MVKINEESDLELVKELVFRPRGLSVERFSKEETSHKDGSKKSPDFKVFFENQLSAYCEVKSPRDDWLDDKLEKAPPLEIVGGLRKDPIFNRLARLTKKAAQQFDSVNAKRTIPNILVFVNHDEMAGWPDLYEILSGYASTDKGELLNLGHGYIANIWLGDDRKKIDLYLWLDAKERGVDGRQIFGQGDHKLLQSVCDLMKVIPPSSSPTRAPDHQ